MTRPTLRQLEYAIAVADELHFGRAAQAAMVSQPGLSAQVRELERSLGVELFERSHSGTRLTPAGAAVIDRARQVLRAVGDLEHEAQMHRGGLHGPIRVGAIPTMAPYLLPALVRSLAGRWPDVQLQLLELQTSRLVEAVEQGAVDIGLLATPVDTGTLHVHPLTKEDFVLALPRGHPLAKGAPLPLSTLRDLPVLLMEDGHCLHEHVQTACALAGQPEVTVVRSAGLSTVAQMVVAGAGVTLLPESAVKVEARPGSGLVVRRFQPPAPGRTVALVWRPTDPRAGHFDEAATSVAPALVAHRPPAPVVGV